MPLMRDPKRKHLRWKGNQWQFYKRFPKDVAALLSRDFFIQNLGTADLLQAQKIRLRKLVEFDELCDAARKGANDADEETAQYLREVADLHGEDGEGYDRDTTLLYLEEQAEKRPDGRQWYRKITGQAVPVSQHVDRFVSETNAVETTQKARRAEIKKFEQRLEQMKLDPEVKAVTKKVAGEYVSYLHSQGKARKTVNGRIQYLSSYWKWMVKRGLASDNPWVGQQVSGDDTENERDIWESEEITRLIKEAPTFALAQAIAVASLTGFRAGEIARITVADCKDGVFSIRKGKTKAAIRTVPVHSQLEKIVAALTAAKGDDELLFPEFGGKAKTLVKKFSQHRAKLFGKADGRQASKTLHSLRHTFVTTRLRAGCSEPIVGSLAGHKPKSVTLSVYHHGFSEGQLKNAVEACRLKGVDSLLSPLAGDDELMDMGQSEPWRGDNDPLRDE